VGRGRGRGRGDAPSADGLCGHATPKLALRRITPPCLTAARPAGPGPPPRPQVRKGKSWVVRLADKEVDFTDTFKLFCTTRLPNPHFTPELSAKVTVVDFTVTMAGASGAGRRGRGRHSRGRGQGLQRTLGPLR
jgi:hypothetical protein